MKDKTISIIAYVVIVINIVLSIYSKNIQSAIGWGLALYLYNYIEHDAKRGLGEE